MKKNALKLALIFLPFFAGGQNVSVLHNFKTCTIISLPIPQNYDGMIKYLDANDLESYKTVNDVKHDNTILSSFNNIVSSVSVYQVDEDGSLSFMGNSISAKNSVYEVIYDFTQTQTILIDDTTFILVGAGVRMVAKIKTKSAGINLANIEGLGIAVNRKKVTGSLEVRSTGVSSTKIQIPATTDLSQSSISSSLQTVATIKSYFSDKETKITPQILAIGQGISNLGGNGNLQIKINNISNLHSTINAMLKDQRQN
jgi:hypothetical protein